MNLRQQKGRLMLFDEEVSYTIERKNVKNINFRFGTDSEIKISAPCYVKEDFIISVIMKNREALYKSLLSFKNKKHFSLDALQYVCSEEIYFFGRRARLMFDPSIKESCFSEGVVFIKESEGSKISKRKKALSEYLDTSIEKMLLKLSEEIYEGFFKERVPMPNIIFKAFKSRWGSCCKSKNLITYNRDLVFLPLEFSRYVVVHEFCHLIVFDHSKAFYAEVEKIMPDYKRIRNFAKEYSR